jgi:hypothetical protein
MDNLIGGFTEEQIKEVANGLVPFAQKYIEQGLTETEVITKAMEDRQALLIEMRDQKTPKAKIMKYMIFKSVVEKNTHISDKDKTTLIRNYETELKIELEKIKTTNCE